MKNENVRITLRIPSEVHAQAVELARKSERSLNWQMVDLIRKGAKQLATQNPGGNKSEKQ